MIGRKLFKEVDEPLSSNIIPSDSSKKITEKVVGKEGLRDIFFFQVA
ncbi:hypothetical protein [Candidatus Nitrosocosmicus hydrocola]|nr:hypothetical protein [Candidatus Nitrosocosmicus hydrocola]